ncbi:MAG: hypothetical protein QM698_11160 [Micropepsaceae bacterium]
MTLRLFLIAVAFALLTPAQAAPPLADCSTAAFGLASAGADAGWSCEELGRREVAAGGGVIVRVLHDATTDANLVKQHGEVLLEAAVQALGVYRDSGVPFTFNNISIVLIDPANTGKLKWSERIGDHAADASALTYPTDCIVRFEPTMQDGSVADGPIATMQFTVAHEVFHCVQGWSFTDAYKLHRKGADWWVEGSAEFFAHLAFESPEIAKVWGDMFKADWPQSEPLTRMKYAAFVFFAWLWGEGPDAMAGFFAGLNSSYEGEEAQQNALRKAVSDEQLTHFVEAYMGSGISLPKGTARFQGTWDESQTIQGDSELSYESLPFQIEVDDLNFKSGVYNVFGNGALDWSIRIDGGDWQPFDPMQEIDACDKTVNVKVARLRVNRERAKISVTRQPKGCEPCLTLEKKEQCFVGTWKLSDQAILDMLTGWTRNKTMTWDTSSGEAFIKFDKDGRMFMQFADFTIGGTDTRQVNEREMTTIMTVHIDGIDESRWTSGGGRLASCKESEQIELTSTVEIVDIAKTSMTHTGLMGNQTFAAQCSGSELILVYEGDVGDHEKPYWTATRVK